MFGGQNSSDPTPISSALVSELTARLQGANKYAAEQNIATAAAAASNLSYDDSDTDQKSSSSVQRKDSFYESDEEVRTTPRQQVSPRKQKSEPEEPPPSYESAVEVGELGSPPPVPSSKPPVPHKRHAHGHTPDYENVGPGGLSAEGQSEASFLPSYEEAMFSSGDVDGDAPPPPPRVESQGEISGQLTVDVTAANKLDQEQVQRNVVSHRVPITTEKCCISVECQ
jgi:hypothetical protein